MRLVPKNWAVFQHYKDRCPPWIKLHRDLLNDRAFMRLPVASKALAPLLWLLASESKDGSFDADHDELEFRLRFSKKDLAEGLRPLIDNGFFIVASGVLAECVQDAIPETEREVERETKKEAEKRSPNGSRLAPDWSLPDHWKQWAEKERPDLDIPVIAAQFHDFWIAKPGKDGRKLDWQATWRNWIRSQRAVNKPINPADVARVTVPSRQAPDRVLEEIKAHKGAPIPAEIRERMRGILGQQA